MSAYPELHRQGLEGIRGRVGARRLDQELPRNDSLCRARHRQRCWAGTISQTNFRAIRRACAPSISRRRRIISVRSPKKLAAHSLVTPASRIIVEKPIGKDGASAACINDAIGAVFPEEQIFRIDHYLGKETVQNLMALRFANALFEPLWNSAHIDHVEITVAESIGVEGRAAYYENSGALRDMVQNHLLQLLCLVAMEPPASLEADAVRDEKLKVLKSLVPIDASNAAALTVRGQYRAGASEGGAVPGYAEEVGNEQTQTETFVALKVEIANWRWAGTPFYLRTGKRLPQRVSEVIVAFREVPHSIFRRRVGQDFANEARHPAAAGRGHQALADAEGAGRGRHAAAACAARHELCRSLQHLRAGGL